MIYSKLARVAFSLSTQIHHWFLLDAVTKRACCDPWYGIANNHIAEIASWSSALSVGCQVNSESRHGVLGGRSHRQQKLAIMFCTLVSQAHLHSDMHAFARLWNTLIILQAAFMLPTAA